MLSWENKFICRAETPCGLLCALEAGGHHHAVCLCWSWDGSASCCLCVTQVFHRRVCWFGMGWLVFVYFLWVWGFLYSKVVEVYRRI